MPKTVAEKLLIKPNSAVWLSALRFRMLKPGEVVDPGPAG
jgi:hypothetical protein